MKYHNITHQDMLNGDGLRVVLWVAGCTHHCKGCQNPITWNPNNGIEFDELALKEIINDLKQDWCSGITFSGGDPLHENNIDCVGDIINYIKKYYPKKTIWMYTGYTYEYILNNKKLYGIIKNIDILIDGKFEIDKLSPNKHWVGSENQRVIDVKKSLLKGEIILKP